MPGRPRRAAPPASGRAPRRRTPMPGSSTRNRASVHWSPHYGNATMGTPAATVSNVEFHPQCVRKHAVDGCASTHSCGLHGITAPRTGTESRNPAGRCGSVSGRTTHRNGRPIDASPCAISMTSAGDSTTTLPTDAYTTDRGGCASNHSTQSAAALIRSSRTSSSSCLCCCWSSMSGPTGMSSGGRSVTPGSTATTSASSSANDYRGRPDM
ncbi:hypothetical protein PVAP13_7NG081642 [Panicum virgatum]|uniref:Uncharacterized protein n=1 Tax=Panicum virgatum TaxID=38727 RepID=A0A8T0PTJ2_PANVG|nr:hypothetical protein PVAP13_7NG081642 [Panicum virgatum]